MNGDRDNGLSVLRTEQPPGMFEPSVQPFAELTGTISDRDNQWMSVEFKTARRGGRCAAWTR